MSEKPITVKREELLQGIYYAINQAQLPAFVIEDALRRILADVEVASKQQFTEDLQSYQIAEEQERQEEQEEQGEE